jgi:TolB-like protein
MPLRTPAALALICLFTSGLPGRALAGPNDEAKAAVPEVARKAAASLAKAIEPGRLVAVQPLGETGGAKGSGLGAALETALLAQLKVLRVSVRDAEAVAAARKEKSLVQKGASAALLVVGEVIGGEPGSAPKASLRLVAAATGEQLASLSLPLAKEVAPGPAPAAAAVLAAATAPALEPKRGPGQSSSVDVAMRKVADQLMTGWSAKGSARYSRLAVLPFSEVGAEAKKRELGAVVTAELSTSLRRDQGALLVERQKLTQVMGEIKLGNSGMVDPRAAPEIGKLADAQALVLGSVSEAGDRFLIDARVVSTESAETLSAASESVPAGSLVALSSEAVVLRSRKDAAFRSVLIAGWGQIYNREPAKGYAFLGAVYGSAAAAVAFHLLGAQAERTYKDTVTPEALCASAGLPSTCTPAQQQQAADSLRTKAESRYSVRNVAAGVAVGLWVVNILDAYVSGIDGDKLLGGTSAFVLPAERGGVSTGVAFAKRF